MTGRGARCRGFGPTDDGITGLAFGGPQGNEAPGRTIRRGAATTAEQAHG
jgi:hypothetical protein